MYDPQTILYRIKQINIKFIPSLQPCTQNVDVIWINQRSTLYFVYPVEICPNFDNYSLDKNRGIAKFIIVNNFSKKIHIL